MFKRLKETGRVLRALLAGHVQEEVEFDDGRVMTYEGLFYSRPRGLPGQINVRIAHRLLPDWFNANLTSEQAESIIVNHYLAYEQRGFFSKLWHRLFHPEINYFAGLYRLISLRDYQLNCERLLTDERASYTQWIGNYFTHFYPTLGFFERWFDSSLQNLHQLMTGHRRALKGFMEKEYTQWLNDLAASTAETVNDLAAGIQIWLSEMSASLPDEPRLAAIGRVLNAFIAYKLEGPSPSLSAEEKSRLALPYRGYEQQWEGIVLDCKVVITSALRGEPTAEPSPKTYCLHQRSDGHWHLLYHGEDQTRRFNYNEVLGLPVLLNASVLDEVAIRDCLYAYHRRQGILPCSIETRLLRIDEAVTQFELNSGALILSPDNLHQGTGRGRPRATSFAALEYCAKRRQEALIKHVNYVTAMEEEKVINQHVQTAVNTYWHKKMNEVFIHALAFNPDESTAALGLESQQVFENKINAELAAFVWPACEGFSSWQNKALQQQLVTTLSSRLKALLSLAFPEQSLWMATTQGAAQTGFLTSFFEDYAPGWMQPDYIAWQRTIRLGFARISEQDYEAPLLKQSLKEEALRLIDQLIKAPEINRTNLTLAFREICVCYRQYRAQIPEQALALCPSSTDFISNPDTGLYLVYPELHLGRYPRFKQEDRPIVSMPLLQTETSLNDWALSCLQYPESLSFAVKQLEKLFERTGHHSMIDAKRFELLAELSVACFQTFIWLIREPGQEKWLWRKGAEETSKRLAVVYKQLALKYHPDKNPQGEEIFKRVKASHDTCLEQISEILKSEQPPQWLINLRPSVRGNRANIVHQEKMGRMIEEWREESDARVQKLELELEQDRLRSETFAQKIQDRLDSLFVILQDQKRSRNSEALASQGIFGGRDHQQSHRMTTAQAEICAKLS